MIDSNKVDPALATTFTRLARRAKHLGYAVGSTSEQIVAAFINGRADWLPDSYTDPLRAIERLHAGGDRWWHTMLYVARSDWQE